MTRLVFALCIIIVVLMLMLVLKDDGGRGDG